MTLMNRISHHTKWILRPSQHGLLVCKPWTFRNAIGEFNMYWRLSGKQKEAYKIAKDSLTRKPLALKHIYKAAQIFERVGLVRQSGHVYVRYQCLEEAAQLYLRHQNYLQAARIFVDLQKWKEAGQCYERSGRPLKAGHCAYNNGNYRRAADLFAKAGHLRAAAKCEIKLGRKRNAAFLMARHGDLELAKNMLKDWMSKDPNASSVLLNKEESRVLIHLLTTHGFDLPLARLLYSNGMSFQLLLKLVELEKYELASEVYRSAEDTLRNNLIEVVAKEPFRARGVLKFLQNQNDQKGVAKILEFLGHWEEAASAYELAGFMDEAYACSLKSGDWAKAERLRGVMSQPTAIQLPPLPSRESIVAQGSASTTIIDVSHRSIQLMNSAETLLVSIPAPIEFSLDQTNVKQIPDAVQNSAVTASEETELLSNVKNIPAIPETAVIDQFDTFTHWFTNSEFIGKFPQYERRLLWELGEFKTFKSGDVLLDFYEEAEGMITVLDGELQSFKFKNFPLVEGSRGGVVLGPGANVGQSWALMMMNSGIKLVAHTDLVVHVLDREKLQAYVQREQRKGKSVVRHMASNLVSHLGMFRSTAAQI